MDYVHIDDAKELVFSEGWVNIDDICNWIRDEADTEDLLLILEACSKKLIKLYRNSGDKK